MEHAGAAWAAVTPVSTEAEATANTPTVRMVFFMNIP